MPVDLDPNTQWTKEDFTHYLIMAMEAHYNMPMIHMMYIEAAEMIYNARTLVTEMKLEVK